MKKIAFFIFLIFFAIALYALPHYGPNWDETSNHFTRGQAILHFFLTGKKDYKDIPLFTRYYQKDDDLFFNPVRENRNKIFRRSMYMDDQINFKYFENFIGHPPLSDISSAGFNLIFFQKLGLINDVDSYHVYSIFLSALLIAIIFFWVSRTYGKFAGLISALALSLYPLFLGESHFNIKDPPEAVFYSIALITFYEGVIRKNNKILVLSSVLAGFAFATKFNIIFAPFTIVPWIIFYLKGNKQSLKKYLSILPSIIVYPLIPFAILFASWPLLWSSPVQNFFQVVDYYKSIGTDVSFDPRFLTIFGINTYALKWILYSTPIIILFLSFFGVFYILKNLTKEKDKRLLFILLWFIVPILRVTRPDAGIYGGLRQIMEYIPPMAIISGIGAMFLKDKIIKNTKFFKLKNKSFILSLIFILLFVPTFIKIIQIHPNEGIYFNELIGGLKGAKEKNLPGWGDSLGNPYRQGLRWINENAPKGSNVTINFGTGGNIPLVFLRKDLHFSNAYRSGLQRKGEYIIGLTHGTGYEDTFWFEYLNNYLIPIYQVKVDSVPIMKIWKNDLAHTNNDHKNSPILLEENPKSYITGNTLFIDFGKIYSLEQVYLKFNGVCAEDADGSIQFSSDAQSWKTLDNSLSAQFLLPDSTYLNKNEFLYYLAREKGRYMEINFTSDSSCFKSVKDIKIYGFTK